jgi:hypothetical protein
LARERRVTATFSLTEDEWVALDELLGLAPPFGIARVDDLGADRQWQIAAGSRSLVARGLLQPDAADAERFHPGLRLVLDALYQADEIVTISLAQIGSMLTRSWYACGEVGIRYAGHPVGIHTFDARVLAEAVHEARDVVGQLRNPKPSSAVYRTETSVIDDAPQQLVDGIVPTFEADGAERRIEYVGTIRAAAFSPKPVYKAVGLIGIDGEGSWLASGAGAALDLNQVATPWPDITPRLIPA